MKIKFIVASFSHPIKNKTLKSEFYHIMASTYFEINKDFNISKLIEKSNYFGDTRYKIIIIEEDISIFTPIISESNITIERWCPKIFFDKEIYNFFIRSKTPKSNIIYIFKNITWQQIVANFRMHKIIVSGGSTIKRHILSPIQIKLSIFMIVYEGNITEDLINKISDSFYLKERYLEERVQSRYDFTSKLVSKIIDDELKLKEKEEENIKNKIKDEKDNEE